MQMLTLAAVLVGSTPWTQADVDSAINQGAFMEVLERAADIPPPARTEAWRTAVTRAAVGVVAAIPAKKGAPFASAEKASELRARYTFLSKQPAFTAAHDAAVLTGYDACLKAREESCEASLLANSAGLSPQSAMAAAAAFRKAGGFAHSAMPWILQSVRADPSQCKNPMVSEATLAALATPAESEVAGAAREVAFGKCFAVLSPALKLGFRGASRSWFENVCKDMRKLKALTDIQRELCDDEGQ